LDQLEQAIAEDRDERQFIHVKEIYDKTVDDNKNALDDLIKDAKQKIIRSKHVDERTKILDDVNGTVDRLVDKMEKIGVLVDDIIPNVGSVEKVEELKHIREAIENYPPEIRKSVKAQLEDTLKEAGKNDEMSADELLQVYHAFSVEMDTVGGHQIDPDTGKMVNAEDTGIHEEVSMVRNRLERIINQLEGLYATEVDLREKVQSQVDRVFDEEALLGSHWSKTGPRFTWVSEGEVFPTDAGKRNLVFK